MYVAEHIIQDMGRGESAQNLGQYAREGMALARGRGTLKSHEAVSAVLPLTSVFIESAALTLQWVIKLNVAKTVVKRTLPS